MPVKSGLMDQAHAGSRADLRAESWQKGQFLRPGVMGRIWFPIPLVSMGFAHLRESG
jgi:hypothetical protein